MSTRREAAIRLVLAFGFSLELAGCGTKPRTPAAAVPSAPTPPAPAASQPDVVETEQQWLLSFFSGTPVEIARGADGALTITVPAEFCFHAGSAIIKPPLAKVLEKVGLSLRRRPQLRVSELEAPADAGADAALARQRALAVQRRLRSFGIARQRFGTITVARANQVLLRLRLQPQADPR